LEFLVQFFWKGLGRYQAANSALDMKLFAFPSCLHISEPKPTRKKY